MRLFLNRYIVYALLVPALAFFLWRGFFPALTHIDTDFPNYYTAGKIVAEGNDMTRLYDDAWFQERIYGNGIHQLGKFSPFPPPTALLFVPLSVFEPMTALRIMTIINLLLLISAVFLLSRSVGLTIAEATLLVLLAGVGLVNCFRFGQLYIALSTSIIAGYYWHRRGKQLLAGVSFGLLAAIKYLPMVFVMYFLFRRQWKLVAAAAATVSVIWIASIGIMGWNIHEQFFSSVAWQHLSSNLSMQDPFSAIFQTWDSLFRRLFIYDEVRNPSPILVSSSSYYLAKGLVIAVVIGLTIFVISTIQRSGNSDRDSLAVAILTLCALLVAPATATYHFVLLWLPSALLLKFFVESKRRGLFWFSFCTYAAIGIIPYSLVRQFDGAGLATILAYPRLFLVCCLFLAGIAGALRLPETARASDHALHGVSTGT